MAPTPLRMLIVDDASLYRRALAGELNRLPEMHVLTCDGTVEAVRAELLQHHPEAIVLDLRPRQGDALAMLRRLRMNYPVPTFISTDAVGEPRDLANRALELGATAVVRKPANLRPGTLAVYARDLAQRIRSAVLLAARPGSAPAVAARGPLAFEAADLDPNQYVIVMGASTGGTEALARVFRKLPADTPPVAVVQHMPVNFTRSFAERLNGLSALSVSEARDGDVLRPGTAVLARGDTHLTLRPAGTHFVARYTHQAPVNRHCPSVDVLFDSVVPLGSRAVGVLLTGMGGDGAQGLLRMRRAGALTLAQSEASCVVYGMPKVAVDLGAVEYTATPDDIVETIIRVLRERRGSRVRAGV